VVVDALARWGAVLRPYGREDMLVKISTATVE